MDKLLHRWGRNRKSIPIGLEGVYLQNSSLMDIEHQNQQEQPVIHITSCDRNSEPNFRDLNLQAENENGQQIGSLAVNRQSATDPRHLQKEKDKGVNQRSGLWKKLEETAEHTKKLLLGDSRQRSRSHSFHSKSGSNRKSPFHGKSPGRTGVWRKQHRNHGKNHLTVF